MMKVETRRSVALLVLLTLFTFMAASSAEALRYTSAENRFLRLINETRAEHDLQPLRMMEDLSDVSYAWSVNMSERDVLEHNPHFASEACCWEQLAENVGYSSGVRGHGVDFIVDELHDRFLESESHFVNIVGENFDEVGIGVEVNSEHVLWVTVLFREADGNRPPYQRSLESSGSSDVQSQSEPASRVTEPSSDVTEDRGPLTPNFYFGVAGIMMTGLVVFGVAIYRKDLNR